GEGGTDTAHRAEGEHREAPPPPPPPRRADKACAEQARGEAVPPPPLRLRLGAVSAAGGIRADRGSRLQLSGRAPGEGADAGDDRRLLHPRSGSDVGTSGRRAPEKFGRILGAIQ